MKINFNFKDCAQPTFRLAALKLMAPQFLNSDFSFWDLLKKTRPDARLQALLVDLLECGWAYYLSAYPSDFLVEDCPEVHTPQLQPHAAHRKIQAGWIHLMFDRDAKARESIEQGLKISLPVNFHLHSHRAFSGLAVLDMKTGDYHTALSRLRIAASLEIEMDPKIGRAHV